MTTAWAVRDKLDREDSATHRALLDAARRVFEDRGYARATIADITRAAGVGRATFYVYFASREEVFAAVARELRDRLVAAQDLGSIDPADPVAVARATTAAYLATYAGHLGFLTVLDHQALADPEIAELRDEIHALPIRRATRWIQQLVDEGVARPASSPELVALASTGLVAAFAARLDANPQLHGLLADELAALYLRLLGVGYGEPRLSGR